MGKDKLELAGAYHVKRLLSVGGAFTQGSREAYKVWKKTLLGAYNALIKYLRKITEILKPVLEAVFASVKDGVRSIQYIIEEAVFAIFAQDVLSSIMWMVSLGLCYIFHGTPLEDHFQVALEEPGVTVPREILEESLRQAKLTEEFFKESLRQAKLTKELAKLTDDLIKKIEELSKESLRQSKMTEDLIKKIEELSNLLKAVVDTMETIGRDLGRLDEEEIRKDLEGKLLRLEELYKELKHEVTPPEKPAEGND